MGVAAINPVQLLHGELDSPVILELYSVDYEWLILLDDFQRAQEFKHHAAIGGHHPRIAVAMPLC